jgi:DNA (cytosine-5)-methyltransferase 1
MAEPLAVREIPDGLFDWLQEDKERRMVSHREAAESILAEARTQVKGIDGEQMPQPPEPVGGDSALPFRFIDLFAGIGGFRIGMEELGGRCVFTSEWDKFSQKTYASWFGEKPHGDINKVKISEIPDHDLLCAGFPCQPFSIAGVSKKNSLGREHGFKCKTQGTLFFRICEIIEAKEPPVIMLENVKNLRSHNRGDTWRVIRESLDELGYDVHADVVDGAGWVPQHRERIFIVGFRRDIFGEQVAYSFPKPPSGKRPRFIDILEKLPDPRYTLTDHLWEYLQNYAAKHKALGNGFGFGLTDPNGVSRTLSARYYKDGSEVLIGQKRGRNPRRLTPREAARLMGFPDHLPIVVSDTQAYKQFGNAVIPPVVKAVGSNVVAVMRALVEGTGGRCLIKGVYGKTNAAARSNSHPK